MKFASLLVFACVLSFVFSAGISADSCRTHSVRNVVSHHNVRDVQVVVESSANIIIVGVPIENINAPYYWSVGAQIREEEIARKVVQAIRKDKGNVGQERKKIGREKFKLRPEREASEPPVDRSLDTQVVKLFEQNCVMCHKPGTNAPGNIKLLDEDKKLFVYDNVEKELARRERILVAIDAQEDWMPKGKDRLPDASIEVVEKWRNLVK